MSITVLYFAVLLLSSMSARSLFAALIALTLIGFIGLRLQNRSFTLTIAPLPYDVAFAVFVAYAILSTFWAAEPYDAILKTGILIVPYLCLYGVLETGAQSSTWVRHAALRGFLAAVIGLGILIAGDIVTNRSLSLWLVNTVPGLASDFGRHVTLEGTTAIRITDAGIDRTILTVTLTFIPAWLATAKLPTPAHRLTCRVLLAIPALVTFVAGPHQTSQLAAAAALLIAVLQRINLGWARRLLLLAWTIACLFVLPLCIWGYETAKLQDSRWLFSSARTRVFIWGHIARATLDHPILGVGANGTARFVITTKDKTGKPDYRGGPISHPHNGYLQVWYELGVLGAALFWAIGTGAIAALRRLDRDRELLTAPLIAVLMTVIGTSYGLWQIWMLSAIALALAFHGLACADVVGRSGNSPLYSPVQGWHRRGP